MYFDTNLKYLIENQGITQKHLSTVLLKTPATISEYMNGKSKPTFEGLLIIADFFKISLDSHNFAGAIFQKQNS